MIPYNATTEDILVTVRPVYLDGKSDVMAARFVFGYFVRIENQGPGEVQLLRRHWYIRDSNGKVEELEGEGVIGVQPVIAIDGVHEYNSYCVLETFTGSMHGYYLMERENGERFRVVIPKFDLCAAVN
jgi:ApaG protein